MSRRNSQDRPKPDRWKYWPFAIIALIVMNSVSIAVAVTLIAIIVLVIVIIASRSNGKDLAYWDRTVSQFLNQKTVPRTDYQSAAQRAHADENETGVRVNDIGLLVYKGSIEP